MRVLIVDTYYPAFIDATYAADPDLEKEPYLEQLSALMSRAFGTADFYSQNLRRLGHSAEDVVANCTPLQRQWARENGRGSLPVGAYDDFEAILLAQIQKFEPDVIHFQDCINTSVRVVASARRHSRCVTTQVACPFPPSVDFSHYDLVLSSIPHFVQTFRSRGIASEYFRIGFEASLIERVSEGPRKGAVFVGGLSNAHRERFGLLAKLAERDLIDWWGYGVEQLDDQSPLRRCYRGAAWGLDMYGVLANCAVSINSHIDVAGPHANNCRLYESTGMGALLLTDWKSNLSDLFEPGVEVVAYRTPDECAELIVHFAGVHDEARRIAEAGQRRTLEQHTYAARMAEFVEITGRYRRR